MVLKFKYVCKEIFTSTFPGVPFAQFCHSSMGWNEEAWFVIEQLTAWILKTKMMKIDFLSQSHSLYKLYQHRPMHIRGLGQGYIM